jgi:hypothetical protein
VRFINHTKVDGGSHAKGAHGIPKRTLLQSLRRDVAEQCVPGLDGGEFRFSPTGRRIGTGDPDRSIDALSRKAIQLIVDQGDDRVDHKRAARQEKAGKLVDQALASPGGEKNDGISPAQKAANRCLLPARVVCFSWVKLSFGKDPAQDSLKTCPSDPVDVFHDLATPTLQAALTKIDGKRGAPYHDGRHITGFEQPMPWSKERLGDDVQIRAVDLFSPGLRLVVGYRDAPKQVHVMRHHDEDLIRGHV